MASPLSRMASRAAGLARSRAAGRSVAGVSTHAGNQQEPHQIDQDVYAPEEHKWQEERDSRFPKTVSVPEGGPRVSFPDFPTIMRHSLTEPFYGSFGHSLREPAYEFVPKRHLSSNRAPPSRRRRAAPQPADDDGCNEYGQSPAVWHLG